MSIPTDEKLPFESILRYIALAARDALKVFTETQKTKLMIYFIGTILCLFLDLIHFFQIVSDFAEVYSAFADLALLAISAIFLFIDWFYIMWVVSLSYKFPSYVSTGFIKGFCGLMETLNSRLGAYLQNKRANYEYDYRQKADRYSYTKQLGNQQQNAMGL